MSEPVDGVEAPAFWELTTTEANAMLGHSVAASRGWVQLAPAPTSPSRGGLPSKTTSYAPTPEDAVALRQLLRWPDPTADIEVRVQWREYVHYDREQGYYNDAVLDVISDGSMLAYVGHDEPADALTALFAVIDEHYRS